MVPGGAPSRPRAWAVLSSTWYGRQTIVCDVPCHCVACTAQRLQRGSAGTGAGYHILCTRYVLGERQGHLVRSYTGRIHRWYGPRGYLVAASEANVAMSSSFMDEDVGRGKLLGRELRMVLATGTA